ncbi:MAG: hypothetical protein H0U29_05360 [Acidimicrobiia bacterium]|nr:hypothetical protein [Acidimicrobiia bacterium]
MTQYMLSVHHQAGDPEPSEDEMQASFKAVDVFNAKITEAGQWVFGGGLMSRETATVVDATKGDTTITDGPFIEAKEWLGGFWVVELPDLDAALAMAKEASAACSGSVEVRPFQEG